MRRLILLLLFPTLVSADEGLHALTINHSQYKETLTLGSITRVLSPETYGLAYSFISESGSTFRADIWDEAAQGRFAGGARVENKAWGAGLSLTYPVSDIELEVALAYSRPKLKVSVRSDDRFRESTESLEYALGISDYLEYKDWSLIPSLELGYQHIDQDIHEWREGTLISSIGSQSGWFLSSSLSLSYLHDIDQQTTLSPFIGLSWTDFVHGEGSTRTSVIRRNITLGTAQEEVDFDTSSTGMVSIGLSLSYERYHVDLSIDESIDLPSVDTQLNLGLGIVW